MRVRLVDSTGRSVGSPLASYFFQLLFRVLRYRICPSSTATFFWISLLSTVFQPPSFAQISIGIFPDFFSNEIQTNHDAQIGNPGVVGSGILITGSLIGTSPLTTTRLRITFPGPITASTGFCADPNNFSDGSSGNGQTIDCSNGVQGTTTTAPALPSGDPLRIEGAAGLFAGVKAGSGGLRLNTSSSRIEVLLPGTAPGDVNTNSGSFRI